MAIGIRNASSGTVTSGGVTLITMPVPTGTVDGDFMLMHFTSNVGAAQTVTPPSGWTLVSGLSSTTGLSNTVTSLNLYAYWRFASGEPASYQWNVGTSSSLSGGTTSYTGVDTTTPMPTISTKNTGGSGTALSANAVTPTVDNPWIVVQFSVAAGASTPTVTQPTGYNERYDVGSGGSGKSECAEASDHTGTNGVSTGALSATSTGSPSGHNAITYVLSPVVPVPAAAVLTQAFQPLSFY